MGCSSSRNLQVVNQRGNNAPQVAKTTTDNTKPNTQTASNDNAGHSSSAGPNSSTRKKISTKVKKSSGPIETFTILWEELPSKPEITLEEASELEPDTPMECWDAVRATSITSEDAVMPALKRRGWKTIRLFVSSTFKDFHAEREVLVKQVFPELRIWCEKLKLHLIECDLRWGVPKEATSEETLRICLGEIDRCYEDNQWPFFLNLSSHRSGWIPGKSDVPQYLAREYGWIFGTSITEMEIIHGAFRRANPNALFLIRDPSFISSLPEKLKEHFSETTSDTMDKMELLKRCIKGRFPESRVITYACEFDGLDKTTDTVRAKGLGAESTFVRAVIDFFKARISHQYPLDDSAMDQLEVIREAHEAFLNTRSSSVLGRDEMLDQIQDYICSTNRGIPLVIVGMAGAGKSAVIARSAATTVNKALNYDIPGGSNKGWNVFYHFIGAAPGSTDLGFMLQRMLKELKYVGEIPADMESLVRLSNIVLSSKNLEPTILFFDALNQLDKTKEAEQVSWLPFDISPNARIICSVINDTPCHRSLASRSNHPKEILCGPLDLDSRREIVDQVLTKFNKRLDNIQMDSLLAKEASANPLWLSIACEELRVFGLFSKVTDMIKGLADGLLELLEQVLTRFEEESGGHLMVATLCYLECSRHGLLERELLELLGEDETLKPDTEEQFEKSRKISTNKESTNTDTSLANDLSKQLHVTVEETYRKTDFEEKANESDNKNNKDISESSSKLKRKPLPAAKWAVVFRSLKPFLRPCGDSGEGRLDFYHRAMSKAVRRKYFKVGSEDYRQYLYTYWHGKLAEYFEQIENQDRKAEELPYHLEKLLDHSRLARCLLEWPIFEKLSADEYNIELLRSWRSAGGYVTAATLYSQSLEQLAATATDDEIADKKWRVARFLCHAGQHSECQRLVNEAIDMEQNTLGGRKEKLANQFELLTDTLSEDSKLREFITVQGAKDHYEVVQTGLKAISYRKNLSGDDNKYHLGLLELLVSFHYGAFSQSNFAYKDLTPAEGITKCEVHCNNAIQIFQELGDVGHLAEAYQNVATFVKKEGSSEQMQQYHKALDLCVQAYGENHRLTSRIVFNMGIVIEYKNKHESYHYYLRAYKIKCEILGPTHPSTLRTKAVLDEPGFRIIAESLERDSEND
ncbi:Telomerase protein component 1 [Trichoplax sp. H2]|nr:Telomerase protein component 1 [Trichoplax sp. H2]|eukprot:RDD44588.1 Telomerase protein component 1 [Trichoplax sp. H2]